MNTVTFETALALKDAGFPQPQPEGGQFWYIEEDWYCCFWDDINERHILYNLGMSIDFELVTGLVFAPTAPDILRKIYAPGNGLVLNPLDLLTMVINVEAAGAEWIRINKTKRKNE